MRIEIVYIIHSIVIHDLYYTAAETINGLLVYHRGLSTVMKADLDPGLDISHLWPSPLALTSVMAFFGFRSSPDGLPRSFSCQSNRHGFHITAFVMTGRKPRVS